MKHTAHWFKRSLAMLLVVVALVGLIPTNVFAAEETPSYIPGDVNSDGMVDARDIKLIRQYIVGGYDISIHELAADVNSDGAIDAVDIRLIRQYIVGGYGVELEPGLDPGTATYSVNFYDGDRLIDTLTAKADLPLGAVPAVEKSSKADATLIGYYLDPECTLPFYAENPVVGDMNVYAKYQALERSEEITFTSFAQMDQQPDLSFTITGSGDASKAATLEVKDGSDPVELEIVQSGDNYIVKAVGGFNPGCSYELHLADGWTFAEKADTIRTAAFSIVMEEVENLQMNDEIVYIQDTDTMDYTVGGNRYDVLTSDLVTEAGGSFNYNGSKLQAGTILCIYVGTHPEDRVGNQDTLDPVVYVKVTAATDTTVAFTMLGSEDQTKLYEIPDNFPIIVDALPTATTGTVNINNLDEEVYVMMMGEGYDLAIAKAAIDAGDFITLYVSSEAVETEANVYFGEITAYNAQTGEITFKQTTHQAITESMDLYMDIDVAGEDLLTEEKKQALESSLYTQVQNSGFAEDAAYTLADLVTKTDGFRNSESIQNILITDANGQPLTDDQLQLLNLGSSFELSDDIELTVELVTSGDQLHFSGGTQLAVGIEAEFEVELVDGDKIVIQLSATFVQEVSIDPIVKGSMVKKEILDCIPVPIGVKVNATIDIKSFTAFSFEAVIYTVPKEEKELGWKELKDLGMQQLKDMGVNIPDNLMKDTNKKPSGDEEGSQKPSSDASGSQTTTKKGLKVKDVIKRIRELENKAKKAKQMGEEYQGYLNDAQALWDALEEGGLDPENWKNLAATLGETNIGSQLLEQYNLTTETGLSTEYYEGLEGLMGRYQKMLEQESDWVRLVEKEIFSYEYCVYGVAIGVEVDFTVRADMSLAIGSNLQYEIGKRYEFWFKIGLFKPTAGSSTMDLIDESFAFQFYVMGRLGLKAGISAELSAGLGTGDLASVGISVEMGPYLKIYGFFIYEYTKTREANTTNWVSNEMMAGAVYLEFGLYFIVSFEAEALTKFEYSYDLIDKEIPLLKVGDRRFYYDIAYEQGEDEVIVMKDNDNNADNGITMQLPKSLRTLAYMDIVTGGKGYEDMVDAEYNITLSNPAFTYDKKTDIISVTVPAGMRYMETDLIITSLKHKASFSTYDMSTTIKVIWTDMTASELDEYYTATVRVGNDIDGYETVWSKRVMKNIEFDLPTAEELAKLMNWNEYKYEIGTGYGNQTQVEDLSLIEDKVYDFNIRYKTYSVTVNGVQKPDGTIESRTFTAKFGETFDFSALNETGANSAALNVFTKFSGVTAPDGIDLNKTIDTRMAQALSKGVAVTANYVDYSVTATFTFTGVDIADVQMKLLRGEVPDISGIIALVADKGATVVEIQPMLGAMNGSATYHVICKLPNPDATITFHTRTSSVTVPDITAPWGSVIQLPTPEREGYTFDGWYFDIEYTQPFTSNVMPEGGAALIAKWTAIPYTITLDICGGTELNGEETRTLYISDYYCGNVYVPNNLPTPSRPGYTFMGWYTEPNGGGERIVDHSIMKIAADHTLYAHWFAKQDIPKEAFDFSSVSDLTYTGSNLSQTVIDACYAGMASEYEMDGYIFEFKAQGYDQEWSRKLIDAGVYDVRITREVDDYYNRFQEVYYDAFEIKPASQAITSEDIVKVGPGYLIVDLEKYGPDENATVTYTANGATYSLVPANEPIVVVNIEGEGTITISASGFRNYAFVENCALEYTGAEKGDSTNTWLDAYYMGPNDNYAFQSYGNAYLITREADLWALAAMVERGDTFAGQTFILETDLDLSRYEWVPIGSRNNVVFAGTFMGYGYTISGVYVNQQSTRAAGLFGRVTGTISNLKLENSYIYGAGYAGGIVGSLEGGEVYGCTSQAYVYGETGGGGIVGKSSKSATIERCTSDAIVKGGQAGGIVCYAVSSKINDCVNFGQVYGTANTGGIVATTEETASKVLNCYSTGSVRSLGNAYVGAIVGRNTQDAGTVKYCYYKEGSVTAPDGIARTALGNKTGAVTDGDKKYVVSSFVDLESKLWASAGTYFSYTLKDALTAYNDVWKYTAPNGYPSPTNWTKQTIK